MLRMVHRKLVVRREKELLEINELDKDIQQT